MINVEKLSKTITCNAKELGITPKSYMIMLFAAVNTGVTSKQKHEGMNNISWNKVHERWVIKHRGKYIASTRDKDEAIKIRDSYFSSIKPSG